MEEILGSTGSELALQVLEANADVVLSSYGRSLTFLLTGAMQLVYKRPQDQKDVMHAIKSHLPQGFDRSLLSAKLQARRTKQAVKERLQIDVLREQIRVTSHKQEKIRLFQDLRSRVLTGLLAQAYLHSLTVGLFCAKNSISVLKFVQRRRIVEAQSSRWAKYREWYQVWRRVGFRVAATMAVTSMAGGGSEGSSSPFELEAINEEHRRGVEGNAGQHFPLLPPFPMAGDGSIGSGESPTTPFLTSPELFSPSTQQLYAGAVQTGDPNLNLSSLARGGFLRGGGTAAESLEALAKAFSVRECLDVAIPRALRDAAEVVEESLGANEDMRRLMSPTASIVQEDLEKCLQTLMEKMDKRVCISLWLKPTHASGASDSKPPVGQEQDDNHPTSLPQEVVCHGPVEDGALSRSGRRDDGEEEEESEKVQFSQLAHLQQKAAEAVVPKTACFPQDDGGERVQEEQPPTSTANPISATDALDGGAANPNLIRDGLEALLSDPSAAASGFAFPPPADEPWCHAYECAEAFQSVIHNVSFGELILADGQRMLGSIFQKVAAGLKGLRRYDEEKRSAPVIMLITKLEELRQRLADEQFVVPPYLKLFCTEMVRCSCRQE